MTMPGSTADLVFNDNSRLEIKEYTALAISTKQITDEERAQEDFIRKIAGTQKEEKKKNSNESPVEAYLTYGLCRSLPVQTYRLVWIGILTFSPLKVRK